MIWYRTPSSFRAGTAIQSASRPALDARQQTAALPPVRAAEVSRRGVAAQNPGMAVRS